jgi:hypothetical protein
VAVGVGGGAEPHARHVGVERVLIRIGLRPAELGHAVVVEHRPEQRHQFGQRPGPAVPDVFERVLAGDR